MVFFACCLLSYSREVMDMKLVSWNVNGIRACVQKGFYDFFQTIDADVFCIQESKMQPGQADIKADGYHMYMNSAVRKGYSGTMLFTKQLPLAVTYGMGIEEHDQEGRVITAAYDSFYVVNVYTPNSKEGLLRLDYRMRWEDAFRGYLRYLDAKKPVIVCGDMNVAHQEIDLKNPKTNRRSAGFTDEERGKMSILLEEGFTDTFRFLHPQQRDVYSWWSYRFRAREKNAGWRIDYFLISERWKDRITAASIHTDIYGSDHCPVSLDLAI